MKPLHPRVISASRREEMTGFAPQRLLDTLQNKCPPDRVHTLVLWTKNPLPLTTHRSLRKTLSRYDQIFIHLTITGMGGTPFEPGIPDTKNVLIRIPEILEIVKDPQRISIRFDPIVHLKLPDGKFYSNFRNFERIASGIKEHGIGRVIVSWMTPYPKVLQRLEKLGIHSIPLSNAEWKLEYGQLLRISKNNGIQLKGCCVPEMERSACIDGRLFRDLHPKGNEASIRKAGGQRPHCGCTESWDIGWYHPCSGGCVYCYANPKIVAGKEDFNRWNPVMI
jgi:hypothetical protein